MLANPPGGFRIGDEVDESGDVLFGGAPREGAPRDGDGAGSPAMRPATSGPLLSTVVTFFSFAPF